jgi:hypothetical protein
MDVGIDEARKQRQISQIEPSGGGRRLRPDPVPVDGDEAVLGRASAFDVNDPSRAENQGIALGGEPQEERGRGTTSHT